MYSLLAASLYNRREKELTERRLKSARAGDNFRSYSFVFNILVRCVRKFDKEIRRIVSICLVFFRFLWRVRVAYI